MITHKEIVAKYMIAAKKVKKRESKKYEFGGIVSSEIVYTGKYIKLQYYVLGRKTREYKYTNR